MIGAHQAKIGVAKERAPAHRRPESRQEAHCKIERPGGERIGDVLDLERHRFQPDARRRLLYALDQRRQELDLPEVGHVKAKSARRASRIEAWPVCKRRVDESERLPNRLGELARERRRVHPGRRAHEERIAEERAQPRERIRHRRLRQAEAGGRGRHAALAQHRIEHAQQVQIDVAHIHNDDSYHAYH